VVGENAPSTTKEKTMARTESLPPIALGPGEGEAIWFAGGLLVMKATGDQTSDEFAVVEQTFRQGFATPVHVHHEDRVSFYVLDGEITAYVGDGGPVPAPAGSFIYVPVGVSFAFRVESETARLLNLTTPQHERFFRAGGDPAPTRTLPPLDDPRAQMDLEKIGSAAERFAVQIIGPPPTA
jgi:quercetin dioxygenase-like cupin family protein